MVGGRRSEAEDDVLRDGKERRSSQNSLPYSSFPQPSLEFFEKNTLEKSAGSLSLPIDSPLSLSRS